MRTMIGMMMLTAITFAVTACGGGTTEPTGPVGSAVGAYALTAWNGQPLPAVIFQRTDYREEVVSGTLTLNADGTWTQQVNLRAVSSTGTAPATENTSGTYTQDSRSLSLVFSHDQTTRPATFDGERVLLNGNAERTYRRTAP